MTISVVFEERLEIPFVRSLAEFRVWALSDKFPQQGRIDYIAGRIEVDLSPEDLFTHGTIKTEIVGALRQLVKRRDFGYLFTDQTRISSPAGDLSAEPDVVFVTKDSLRAGSARLVSKASGDPERYVEIEGAADLVVEIVSDSSVTKDTKRLPAAYWQAGVREFWLVDVRHKDLVFQVYRHGPASYLPANAEPSGYQFSAVFGVFFRLLRTRDDQGLWAFDLQSSST